MSMNEDRFAGTAKNVGGRVEQVSWPRFLWTPHCPLKPKRNGRHEGQFA
jgi:hypothetical protein